MRSGNGNGQHHDPGPYQVKAGEQPHLNRARIIEQVFGAVIVAALVQLGNHVFVVRDLQAELRQQRDAIHELKAELHQIRRDLYIPRGSPGTSSISSMRSTAATPRPEPRDRRPRILADIRRRLPA